MPLMDQLMTRIIYNSIGSIHFSPSKTCIKDTYLATSQTDGLIGAREQVVCLQSRT